MLTYEYECESCGLRFEHRQTIAENPITECPKCSGKVRRLISGGSGFIFKESGPGQTNRSGVGCSWERGGKTCCGRDERCGKPPCGD